MPDGTHSLSRRHGSSSWHGLPAPRDAPRAMPHPTLQCGVNKIQSLRDCHPEALFCFCLTCLRAERFRNAEPKEIARTMWECVSERHYLINPRLNAVQSGVERRLLSSSHRGSHLPQGTARTRCETEEPRKMSSDNDTQVPSSI